MYKSIHTCRTIIINVTTNEVIHDTYTEYEANHVLNPIDRYFVPIVSDMIQLLPNNVQEILAHLDEVIGKAYIDISCNVRNIIADIKSQYPNAKIKISREGTALILTMLLGVSTAFISANQKGSSLFTGKQVTKQIANVTHTNTLDTKVKPIPFKIKNTTKAKIVSKPLPVRKKPVKHTNITLELNNPEGISATSTTTLSAALPTIKLPSVIEGQVCPNNANKHIVLTDAQFKTYLTQVYNEFKKYEHTERINPLVETARHTYEAWLHTANGWQPSNLLVVAGNGSGIKGNPKYGSFSYVTKYDDGWNGAIYDGKPSKFIVFQRNDFYDISNWCRYQCTVVLASHYYADARANYKNPTAYAAGFTEYATRTDYTTVLTRRTTLIKRILDII